ncbi:tetrahydrofolate dehydrogenase/cyclohydrolase catalytic domain-containing protein [Streptomyces stelliscabiei]|uniref:tetrahydrofolate dehydrogenase/cyclohydrolase catalytic domain-containing protein n=1 Tax=Streptomyces stelliscabiei TaxID=146820 RepID=UPI001CEF21D2
MLPVAQTRPRSLRTRSSSVTTPPRRSTYDKRRQAAEVGLVDIHRRFPATVTTVTELAADPNVSGILVQLPLPPAIDASAVIDAIPCTRTSTGSRRPSLTARSAKPSSGSPHEDSSNA